MSDAKRIDAAEVRTMVREAAEGEIARRGYRGALGVNLRVIIDAIACRVARQLAGRVLSAPPHVASPPGGAGVPFCTRQLSATPALSAEDIARLRSVRDRLAKKSVCWDSEIAVLDRLIFASARVLGAERNAIDTASCTHPRTERGKDVPRVYGSWRTEVCKDCGAFRTHGHDVGRSHLSGWYRASEYDHATKKDSNE